MTTQGKNQKYTTSADRQMAEWNEPIGGKEEFGNTSGMVPVGNHSILIVLQGNLFY